MKKKRASDPTRRAYGTKPARRCDTCERQEKLNASLVAAERRAEEAERESGARLLALSTAQIEHAKLVLRASAAEARLGPVPDGCQVLAYVSWEGAQEMHALAQPLVDHVEAGKLAKRVVDFLRPGAAVAAPWGRGLREAAEAFYRSAPDPAWVASKLGDDPPVEQLETHNNYVTAMEDLRVALAANPEAPPSPPAETAPAPDPQVQCSRDCDHPRPCPIHDASPRRAVALHVKEPAAPPSPPAETAPVMPNRHGPGCEQLAGISDCSCLPPGPASAAPEANLGEVPARVEYLRDAAWTAGQDGTFTKDSAEAKDAEDALLAAVRSLVAEARREGRKEGRRAGIEEAACWHDRQALLWASPLSEAGRDEKAAGWHRCQAAEVRALAPTAPDAADDKGGSRG